MIIKARATDTPVLSSVKNRSELCQLCSITADTGTDPLDLIQA